ncbi:MAG: dihydrofolate reductase family protein [Chloroflexota bacterium]
MTAQPAPLDPLETLFDGSTGTELPLPEPLKSLYGALRFPLRRDKPYVLANLVTTLDGVVSLGVPGHTGGKDISGSSRQDVMLMGVLRSVSDALIVGAGTLRRSGGARMTAEEVYPPLASAYAELRAGVSKKSPLLNVIVTNSGELDPHMDLFRDGGPVLVVTTGAGAMRARETGFPDAVRIVDASNDGGNGGQNGVSAASVVQAVEDFQPGSLLLVEGGPHLLAQFYAERRIDEQFLTLAPQIAGRDGSGKQLGLVEGKTFAPAQPLWGNLNVVKRGKDHLFLRYRFEHGK